jgi:DNA polymerase-3 subunit epsilon
MPQEAFEIHGLSDAFLADKPRFAEIGQAFLDFIADAKLVIHNAGFDMKFLNAEFGWMKLPPLAADRAIDTLLLARQKFPGAQSSLDALCRRFAIDNSARTLHGALLDSEILAEVYLELIGGRQPDLVLAQTGNRSAADISGPWVVPERPQPLPPRLTEAERAAHASLVERLGGDALWLRT